MPARVSKKRWMNTEIIYRLEESVSGESDLERLQELFRKLTLAYRSLTKVAFAITGTRWSGPKFFGLRDRRSNGSAP
jgi:hypothetical protein